MRGELRQFVPFGAARTRVEEEDDGSLLYLVKRKDGSGEIPLSCVAGRWDMDWEALGTLVLAAGAVGTAAMGLVEACKWTRLGIAGLPVSLANLSPPAVEALRRVYGERGFDPFLEGAWRKGVAEFEQTLRDGLRLAVFSARDLPEFVRAFGEPHPEALADAIELLRTGDPEGRRSAEVAAARARLARFEAVVDARVKAAVAAGRDAYVHRNQFISGAVALTGCVVAWAFAGGRLDTEAGARDLGQAVIVGILSVPLAPVAKDVVTFLNSLRDVFARRKPPAAA